MIKALTGAAMHHLQARPSTAAGICAFGVAFALVAGNALYSQPGNHPEPIWATRDTTTTKSVAGTDVSTGVRSQISTTALRLENVPVPLSRPDRNEQAAPALSLIEEAQRALQAAGYYTGEIDGLYGPMTRQAVIEFQAQNALVEDGQISKALLEKASTAPQKRQTEKPAVIAAPEKTVATIQELALVSMQRAIPAVTPASAEAEPASAEADAAKLFREDIHEIRDSALTARVQIGLINFGETDIAVDGVLGAKTSSAIRTFQERYGLAVTGTPDLAVIRKMEQIGALSES